MAEGRAAAAAAAVSLRGRATSLAAYGRVDSGNASQNWVSGLLAIPAAGSNYLIYLCRILCIFLTPSSVDIDYSKLILFYVYTSVIKSTLHQYAIGTVWPWHFENNFWIYD